MKAIIVFYTVLSKSKGDKNSCFLKKEKKKNVFYVPSTMVFSDFFHTSNIPSCAILSWLNSQSAILHCYLCKYFFYFH